MDGWTDGWMNGWKKLTVITFSPLDLTKSSAVQSRLFVFPLNVYERTEGLKWGVGVGDDPPLVISCLTVHDFFLVSRSESSPLLLPLSPDMLLLEFSVFSQMHGIWTQFSSGVEPSIWSRLYLQKCVRSPNITVIMIIIIMRAGHEWRTCLFLFSDQSPQLTNPSDMSTVRFIQIFLI